MKYIRLFTQNIFKIKPSRAFIHVYTHIRAYTRVAWAMAYVQSLYRYIIGIGTSAQIYHLGLCRTEFVQPITDLTFQQAYITILPVPYASVTKVTSISYKFAAKSFEVIDASKDRLQLIQHKPLPPTCFIAVLLHLCGAPKNTNIVTAAK